MLVHKLLQTAD